MVPNGWEVKILEDLASVERGKFSARPRNDPKYYGGEIPFVQTGDIAGAKTYLKSYSQTLNEEGLKVSRLFPKNTILITIAANIGDVAITSFDVACPDSLVAIQPKENADVVWLYFYLETCQKELDGQATQNAQKNINLQVLRPLKILTPPLPEQQKIAKILSTWDKAISTTERLIDNSTQQKKALMQQLLTGRKRLLDESGERFKGEWEEVKLGKVSDVRDGTHDSPEFIDVGYPLITSKNLLSSGRLDLSNVKFISEEDYLQINKRSGVNDGDILFGMIGTIGNPVKVKSSNYAIKNVALIKETGGLLNGFLIYYLSSHDIDKQIHRLNAGGTQKFVALGVLRNLVIRLPTQQEQQKIATVLINADKEIDLLEQQLADLQQEKKALMQQLLTGKKRVVIDGAVAGS